MKSTLEKLGFKPGMAGWVHNGPPSLMDSLGLPSVPPTNPADLILAFVSSTADVGHALEAVRSSYQRGKALWFAYPKKTGSIRADISRDKGWEPLAAADLLPVTQISIDDTWSALRFRYRDEIKRLTRKADLPGKRD